MKLFKNVCSFILSILIFIITTMLILLTIFNIFINSGFVENTLDMIINDLNEESFIIKDDVYKENSKLVVKKYDDNGNYIGDYEIDISKADLNELSVIIQDYFDQILNYLKNHSNTNEKLYLDGSKLINPVINVCEKVVNEIELKENVHIDRSELNSKIQTMINEIFTSLNNGINTALEDENLPVSYISNFLFDSTFIIILVIFDILMCSLVLLINRQVYSIFYIAVPFGLSGLLTLSILVLLSALISSFILYLIGSIPLLIAIGLIVLFYFIIRDKQ